MAEDPSNYAELLGLASLEMEDGEARVELELTPGHLNLGGIAHGGLLVSLLDFAMGSAVVSTLDGDVGEWCATQSLTTSFLRPVSEGRVVATGRVVRRGRSAAYPEGELRDGAGNLVATAMGVWAIRS